MMSHHTVIVAENGQLLGEVLREAASRFDVVVDIGTDDPNEVDDVVAARCELLVADPSLILPHVDRFPTVAWWQSTWHGVDAILAHPAGIRWAREIMVTSAHGIHAATIAAWVAGYVIALERNVFEHYEDQKTRSWIPRSYRDLSRLTAGIVGTGTIARRVASALASLGLSVRGYSRTGKPTPPFESVFEPAERDSFLESCHVVVALLPLTRETDGLIDATWFGSMSMRPWFLNAGRGATVVEDDLVCALRDGTIAGAALDVFAAEPLDKDSPLWTMPRVYVTPHVAGTSLAEDVSHFWLDNLRNYLVGRPLKGVVRPERGY